MNPLKVDMLIFLSKNLKLNNFVLKVVLKLLASEQSERDTLSRSSMDNAIRIYIYIYIYIHETHFSSVVLGLSNVGGVKCHPFLKHSSHWKRALKKIFKGSRCFQFPEADVTSTAKESLPNVVHYKFSLFYKSRRKCRVESVVYNCNQTSVAKVSLCCY